VGVYGIENGVGKSVVQASDGVTILALHLYSKIAPLVEHNNFYHFGGVGQLDELLLNP
jgi:hypothetical protein